jgi:hypothetical protein
MIRSILALLSIVLICACENQEKTEFKSEECKFSIDFPKMPTNETIDYKEPFSYQVKIFKYTPDSSGNDLNIRYEVRHTAVPKGVLDKLSNEEIHEQLFSMIGEAAEHPEALLEKKILDADDYLCEEYEMVHGEEYGYIRQYYWSNNLYQIYLITKNNKEKNKSIDAFMNSFKILK